MAEDKKACPILSIGADVPLTECQQEKCQWWGICKHLGDKTFTSRLAIKLDMWADKP